MRTLCLSLILLFAACESSTNTSQLAADAAPADVGSSTADSGGSSNSDVAILDVTRTPEDAGSGATDTGPGAVDAGGPSIVDGSAAQPGAGGVGAACTSVEDCSDPGAVCLDLTGGYCAIPDCAGTPDACPEGSACFLFGEEGSYCVDTCLSSDECREDEGYVCDADKTCWPGSTPPATTGQSPIGGACSVDADCKDPGADCYPASVNGQPTGFLNGYCLINGCQPGQCPEGSVCEVIYADGSAACMATCDETPACRDTEGYACYEQGICFPGCADWIPCPTGYACGDKGFCVPDCSPGDCTGGLVCDVESGECVDPPCTPGSCPNGLVCSEASGKCIPDLSGGPGAGPGPSCPDLPKKDCVQEPAYCGELLPFEPVTGPGYDNYPINGETASNQYRSYARRDLIMLVKWATAYVECKAADWDTGNGFPLGLGDMSEADGSIPGTSCGYPGHPAGTHEDGYDIDIAYYQNSLTGQPNNYLRSVCDYTIDGVNQYHCVSEPYMMDIWRTALFLGALFSSPRTRVIGVDGMAGATLSQALDVLCDQGWVPAEGCEPANQDLACEVEEGVDGGLCWEENGSGWFYHHHHHMHLSLWGLAGNSWKKDSTEAEEDAKSCVDPGCVDRSGFIRELEVGDRPGLVRSFNPGLESREGPRLPSREFRP